MKINKYVFFLKTFSRNKIKINNFLTYLYFLENRYQATLIFPGHIFLRENYAKGIRKLEKVTFHFSNKYKVWTDKNKQSH